MKFTLTDIVGNIIGEEFARFMGSSFLDRRNIVWKLVNGEWIGKRSVWTHDWRACWLEDTNADGVKEWWCGKDADYNEIFKREINL